MNDMPPAAAQLAARLASRAASVGVIGLGYVGLPLSLAMARAGLAVTGFDTDPAKIESLGAGRSYFSHIGDAAVAAATGFKASGDFASLAGMDAILICVPTPLGRHREPDLRFVTGTTQTIATHLRPGQLVVLESTTYPGTTTEVVKPILEAGGLRSGTDFFLAYAPEREDPGNAAWDTARIPKLVGGDGPVALDLACMLYDRFVSRTVRLSSPAVAEAAKLTENVFRAVNIALVNELKTVFGAMDIDVWEVIEAAKTKPFGYMPFYPGPGLGGHCIPIDPFYLTWAARTHGLSTRFIELAGEINTAMPGRVIEAAARALDRQSGRGLNSARVLIVGLAYKPDVDDMRESPALVLIEGFEARGAQVDYHDPLIPAILPSREHAALAGRRSIPWTAEALRGYDLAVIATDHSGTDWPLLAAAGMLVVDTRNAMERAGIATPTVVKA